MSKIADALRAELLAIIEVQSNANRLALTRDLLLSVGGQESDDQRGVVDIDCFIITFLFPTSGCRCCTNNWHWLGRCHPLPMS